MNDLIQACLENTATDFGGAYYDVYQTCERKFHLTQLVELRNAPRRQAPDIGSLVHACLRYAGICASAEQDWSNWRQVLAAAPEHGYAIGDCETAESLLDFYWLKWGVENAGYPAGAKILQVEQEWRYEFGALPTTARADTLLELNDEILIVDHKTRSSKVPDGFERQMQTRPQFLRLGALWRALNPDKPRAAIWVNALVKTKLPSFSRHIVRLDDAMLDAWVDNQKRLTAAIASSSIDTCLANFSACDGGFFGSCDYRDYCWGSEAVKTTKYKGKSDG